MDGKKDFFELLEPKSALAVGVVGGFLTLCTIGFFVLGSLMLRGGLPAKSAAVVAPVDSGQVVNQQPAPLPPPPDVPKTAKPKAELFVMSYCPYGLQMEKAYLPVMDLLKKKADIDVKFVSYAMHGMKEVEENTRQYCIQKDQNSKFSAYLQCFATTGDYTSCMKQASVNEKSVTSCMSATDKQFGINALANDQSKWLSGQFPVYPIHQSLNDTYGVQGSPTLVINGVQADVARSPEAIKQAICNAFTNAPEECAEVLSGASYQPGFGMQQAAAGGAGAGAAGCGV